MKYSIDSYRMYQCGGMFSHVIRVVVTMKETVDIASLKKSANTAIKRYPYFAVKVTVDEYGGYVLQPNHEPVAVLFAGKKVPKVGSGEVNGHLLFLEVDGKTISFYISHTLGGGKGVLPWVMTTVYQYVTDKYHVLLDAPGIRKSDSELYSDETVEPSLEMLPNIQPSFEYKSKNPIQLSGDYLNGLFNPFKRNPNYRLYTFQQNDVVSAARKYNTSVSGLFLAAMALALSKVLPEKDRVIGGEIAHSPMPNLGFPNAHSDILSHVHIDYDREKLQPELMKQLGTMTKEQIKLQTDVSVSSDDLRKLFTLYGELDDIKGLKQKRKFIKRHNPSTSKEAKHGTYIVNYSGQMDWGEVADYVDSYVIVVEGHLILELTSMNDRIFISFMQLMIDAKYTNAFQQTLEELHIPFETSGSFPKRLSKHDIPLR